MNTIALAWNSETSHIDLQLKPADRITWLENAVTISLFTDARVTADELPDGEIDQRGYWGDFELPEGESLGSKLWTLKRRKVTQDVINLARDYCAEALGWMVDAEHLQAVNVTAERTGTFTIGFLINCQLPDGNWVELFREHNNAV